jgi:hypothetical protein
VQAAVGSGAGAERRAVGGGDGLDDREPEAVAIWMVGAVTVESLEWLEEAVDVRCGDDRPAVGDGENGVPGFGSRRDGDVTARDVVAKRVAEPDRPRWVRRGADSRGSISARSQAGRFVVSVRDLTRECAIRGGKPWTGTRASAITARWGDLDLPRDVRRRG